MDDNKEKNSPIFRPFKGRNYGPLLGYLMGTLVLITLMNYFLMPKQNISNVDFSTFKEQIQKGEIKRVEMTPSYYMGFTITKEEAQKQQNSKDQQTTSAQAQIYKTTPVQDPSFVQLLDSKGVEYYAVIPKNHPLIGILLTWILPFAVLFFLWRFLSRRMGSLGQNVMTFGQNKTRVIAEGDTGVRFSDVAGAEESKAELVEVVDFLKNPGRYTEIGGHIPKGVLLVGAPGTGKTLLARAVAGEAGVTFFRISGSEFVEMFVGVGAARVRDLFQQARAKAPCIIFVDELDAIGKSRSTGISTNDEREQTLNQLLVEMDGFDARTGVIIIAATNRPEVLDPALLRPGRFDRQVVVDKPDLTGREQILKLHSAEVKLDDSVNLRDVARRTAGFVGADLANLVNEAAIHAVRSGRQRVLQEDFDDAFEKLVAGLEKKNRLINPKERRIVAYHETGHALVAFLTPGADPVEKISIVPRGIGALGYTMQLPTEERFLMTEEELHGKIDVLLGGRAAEQIVFGEISTGAANDLEKAADIARRMITDFGMSDKFRNVFLPSRKQSPFLGENNYTMMREYSEYTQQYIDEETARIIDNRYQNVTELLQANRGAIDRIAERLLKEEVLERQEFEKLLRRYKNTGNEIPAAVAAGSYKKNVLGNFKENNVVQEDSL
jgi:cell division protease FtsH